MDRRSYLSLAGVVTAGLAGCTSSAEPGGAPSDPTVINPIDVKATLSADETHTETITIPETADGATVRVQCLVTLRSTNPEESAGSGMVTITDGQGATLYADDARSSYLPGDSRLYQATDVDAAGGDELDITFEATTGEGLEWRFSYVATVEQEATDSSET